MSRYIKVEDMRAIFCQSNSLTQAWNGFDMLPSIDIEPKRGEWIEHEGKTIVADNNFVDFFPTEYECSNCGLRHATYFINSTLPNFCPNCGADMREREGE